MTETNDTPKKRGGRPKGSKNNTVRDSREFHMLSELRKVEKVRTRLRRQLARLFSK